MRKLISLLIAIIMTLYVSSCRPYKPTNMVFKNVDMIPMTSEAGMENTSVFVSNGIIADIAEFDHLEYPSDTTVIDCEGRFLLPGFSDMHVHSQSREEGSLFIVNGVTLIRNMWGGPGHLEARRRIRNRRLLGPELFTTGPIIHGPGAYWPGGLVISDPSAVPGIIAEIKEAGYDAIKVYDRLSRDVYDAIIEAARDQDIPVVGHVPFQVRLQHVLESGQLSIEHFTGFPSRFLTEEQIKLTVGSGVWLCPTIVVMKNYQELNQLRREEIPELVYVHPASLESWSQETSRRFIYRDYQECLKILYDNGANIVAGTDAGNPYTIAGFSLHDEFQLMQEAGLSPYQVLLTTTVNPALMLGIEERVGTIEIGKDADLVLLEENPLLDIRNTKSICGVMSKGYWLDRDGLDALLQEVVEAFSELE